jgi:hypothetical protein
MKRVSIDPSLMADREMLEDLLVAAVNDAARKVEETVNQKMSSIMPAGLKLPF